jgi:hypothetical protein
MLLLVRCLEPCWTARRRGTGDAGRLGADRIDHEGDVSRAPVVHSGKRSLLLILLATWERALDAFRVADNPADREFVADLERIMERTRGELKQFRQPD